jgi:hypothetical protein
METTSHTTSARADASALADGYLRADFPWYSLDDGWRGRRWLTPVAADPDGRVHYGSIGHGDEPTSDCFPRGSSVGQTDSPDLSEGRRFAVVVTVGARPSRRLGDGTGMLEATSVASAAWLAGSGLLAATHQAPLGREMRRAWLDQQSTLAWELADDLRGPGWSPLTLPVNGTPQPFRYRESEYGWVLAGEAPGVHLGAYGRGVSAYALGFTTVTDLAAYAD